VRAPTTTDCDRDGRADVIATVVICESEDDIRERQARARALGAPLNSTIHFRRVVIAISGRSGAPLWNYPLDRRFTTAPHPYCWERPATIARAGESAIVAIVDGAQWSGINPATGIAKAPPIDLGFVPVRQVQHADLDGDGFAEILALGPAASPKQQTLAAFSCTTGRKLWVQTVNGPFEPPHQTAPQPDWPAVVDLDGDDRPEIIVPDAGGSGTRDAYRGVRLLAGASGKPRWTRPMRPDTKADDRLAEILAAPDIDGDGTRDVVVVSRFDGRNPSASWQSPPVEPESIYVDALSGRDGRALWWWRVDVPQERSVHVWPARWWGRGPDGWPLLAIGLGGRHIVGDGSVADRPGITHVLEASSGREIHMIDGLIETGVGDFDGDGIADLWGQADGKLQAFRGQHPEAWRTLGRFAPTSVASKEFSARPEPAADLDGDGVADALNTDFQAPFANRQPGTRTVLARSGRDGRLLWKTPVDSRRPFDDEERWDWYECGTFSLPHGDIDGDGTPDVFVRRKLPNPTPDHQAAILPLDLISGRTGRHMWSAGPLPLAAEVFGVSQVHSIDVRALVHNGAPEVFALYSTIRFRRGGGVPTGGSKEYRLARIAGRDGRVLWDINLIDERLDPITETLRLPEFGDLDADGALDAVLLLRPSPKKPTPTDFELRGISLRHGAALWSTSLKFASNSFKPANAPQFTMVDFAGDRRPEILVTEEPAAGTGIEFVLKALSGHDGSVLWTWRSGPEVQRDRPVYGLICTGDFDGNGRPLVCLGLSDPQGKCRLILLDGRGTEVARHELVEDAIISLRAADLDLDGRDELVFCDRERLHVLRGDLKDRWSYRDSRKVYGAELPIVVGRSGTTFADRAIGLDGADGRPRWAGEIGLQRHGFARSSLLDSGDSAQLPRLISGSFTSEVTVCRIALPTTSSGAYAPNRGRLARPGPARDDPRWLRYLPWVRMLSAAGPRRLLAAGALALLNVFLPCLVIRLATRRRGWTVGALMAAPVAAAVPLSAIVSAPSLAPPLPSPFPSSAQLGMALLTSAGVPAAAFVVLVTWSLARRRWKLLGQLAVLTALASVAAAGLWLWLDAREMPAIEHYDLSAWYLAAIPGAYAAAVVVLLVGGARGIAGCVGGINRRRRTAASLERA
jgi:hypothetical protein